ncbi:TPR repeat-containing protein [Planctopirus limnophila DSM 3776]|uniref:TPR repeat-containing protein n=1 Tax=Planctopirus limnophila (strain ATCC 43296 / DSM 3776 / IFAM 1008 / Mu 290) TaxID=521674 RepID=D5SUB4_PLAL2|nr:tetratricopeptide repeat protein [Planctopirus limnophila]ADG69167.1 TPR repeat-containing protein [Planctopirus limnophila DSM 3776]
MCHHPRYLLLLSVRRLVVLLPVLLTLISARQEVSAAGDVVPANRKARAVAGNVILVQNEIPQRSNSAATPSQPAAPASEIKSINTEEEIRKLLESWAQREAWDRPSFFDPPRPVAEATSFQKQIVPLVEMANYGWWNDGTGLMRYLAVNVSIYNGGAEPIVIRKDDVSANIGGKDYPFGNLPQRLKLMQFQYEEKSISLKGAEPFAELSIAPGTASNVWLVFAKLETDNNVPPSVITMKSSAGPVVIDVNRQMRSALKLRIELVGPRAVLGLMTISGILNTVNAQDLCRGYEELSLKKVERAVTCWDLSVKQVNSQLLSWLMTTAQQPPGNRPQINYLPEVPAAIQELQLASIPNQRDQSKRGNSSKVVHPTAADAISAALADAYRLLPADEILREIESGHPLAKPAALLHGAARLPSSEVPRVIALTRSEDQPLAKSAVLALGEFSEQPAIDELKAIITSGKLELVPDAAEALATSRYRQHQDVLLQLLKDVQPERRDPILTVLSATPKAAWANVLANYTHQPQGGIRTEVLSALVVLGHPAAQGLLEEAIRSDNATTRKFAFDVLSRRSDRKSRELAMDYALASLDRGEFDPLLEQFLRQVRDPRVLPKLMARLDNSSTNSTADRSGAIRLIGAIADASAGKELADRFDSFKPQERNQLMLALRELKAPEFLPLAIRCIESGDFSQASSALQGLMQESPPDLLAILEKAVRKQDSNNMQQQLMQMIGQVGTPAARELLLKLRDEAKDDTRRDYANAALLNLRQRSPGYQFIYQAQHYLQQKQKKSALECFEIALEVDEYLPEAWAGRGNLRLQEGKIPEARGDFEKSVALDPTNALAVTGYAICLVTTGETDKGISTLEKIRTKHQQDDQYLYNAACVYSRAMEHTMKTMAGEEVINRYKGLALKDLKASIERGFDDFDWVKKDPDLKPLENDPEFKALLEKAPKKE